MGSGSEQPSIRLEILPNDIVARGSDKASPASRLDLSPLLGETRDTDQITVQINTHYLLLSTSLSIYILEKTSAFLVTQGIFWLAY